MLEKIINEIDDEKIKERIKEEYKIIGEDNLNYLLKIKEILNDNFNTYSLSGSINSFYICYYLGITNFNPVKYSVKYKNNVSVSINLELGEKENLVKLLNKKLKYIKKVSNISDEGNTNYNGIVIDTYDKLSTYKTGIIKAKKKEIINKYLVINIYEKQILTLLKDMEYGNEEIDSIFCDAYINKLLKIVDDSMKDKTTFENIVREIDNFNLKKLINKHNCFYISHIDQMILEYKLTYFKCYQPRTYYITYLKYLSNLVDIKTIDKYKDDFSKYFEENKDELTYEYKFYCLWYDANKYLDDLNIDIIDNKIIINYKNIEHKYFEYIDDKFKFINNVISKYDKKEIDIFGYEGDNEYYISNIIANRLGISIFQVSSIINPLGGDKLFFDNEFYNKVDSSLIMDVINYFRDIPTFLHADRYNMDELLSCINCGSEIIIIDDYESFEDIDLDKLEKLNKKIYLLHQIKSLRRNEI